MKTARSVQLIHCTDREYAEFAPLQVAEYARQLVRAGEAEAEGGLAEARRRLDDVVNDRLRAASHTFLVARSTFDGVPVGLWISPAPAFLGAGHERTCWLSQVTVDEPLRRQRWGSAILTALDDYAAAIGVEEIRLRVFDWNVGARRLYESQGYELANQFATDAHLRKRLTHSASSNRSS
jgi:GNAT superfamily N-acetyltransferase